MKKMNIVENIFVFNSVNNCFLFSHSTTSETLKLIAYEIVAFVTDVNFYDKN